MKGEETQLIEIPDWNPNEINIILYVRLYIDDVQSFADTNPIYKPKAGFKCFGRKIRLELQKFYCKFITNDLEFLSKIKVTYPNINFSKFTMLSCENCERSIQEQNIILATGGESLNSSQA